MLNCKDVSKTVSESLDRKLPWWTWVKLWMHLGMCGVCWEFRRALLRIHEEARRNAQDVEQDSAEQESNLSPEALERMKRAFESHLP